MERPMPVNTKRVTGRRTLRFHHVADILADAEALAAGPHHTLGNYTLGEITAHVAQYMQYSLDGFPPVHVPSPIRLVGRLMRRRLLHRGFPAGIKPPAAIAAISMPPKVSLHEGMVLLHDAVVRLRSEPQRHPSPLLGELSPQEWDKFHCRHAELHLSFVTMRT